MTKEERAADPHAHKPAAPRARISASALDLVGGTPCVRINRLSAGLRCELVAKCEFFSAGGSVKDRIGLRMVEMAEAEGRIKPGETLIEPTSGNTGIGLALAAALKGYRMIITLPEKMSQEKVDVLKALGCVCKPPRARARALSCPSRAHGGLLILCAQFSPPICPLHATADTISLLQRGDHPHAHRGGVRLARVAHWRRDPSRKGASKCTHFGPVPCVTRPLSPPPPPPKHTHASTPLPPLSSGNPNNPLVHYDTTAEEIWESCEGKVDMIVCSAGTGGTLTGIARRLKELNPAVIVVGVDPKGSILAEPDALNDERRLESYAVEGIGYDFVPTVLDRALVDEWVKTEDLASLLMARRLIREEGLLCGGSSGSAMVGALAAAARLGPGQRCVVVLPDGIRNYMSKHLRDSWMAAQGYGDEVLAVAEGGPGAPPPPWWARRSVADLAFHTPITAAPSVTVKEAIGLLNSMGIDQLPVVGENNSILGVVTEGNLSARMLSGRAKGTDPVSSVLFKGFRKVTVTTQLHQLARVFDSEHFAVVLQTQRVFVGDGKTEEKSVVVGVVTRIDLLKFISGGGEAGGTPRSPGGPGGGGGGGALRN